METLRKRHLAPPTAPRENDPARRSRNSKVRAPCASSLVLTGSRNSAQEPRRPKSGPLRLAVNQGRPCVAASPRRPVTDIELYAVDYRHRGIPYLNINADLRVPHDDGARCH